MPERGYSCPPGRGAPGSPAHVHKAGERRPRAARVDVQATGSAMFADQAWEQIPGSLGLSGREVQIVRGVFDDRIESAIAADLGISAHTVHTHFERLHRKLRVTTRIGLVLRVTRQFLALTASGPLTTRATAQESPGNRGAHGRGGVSAK